MKNILYLTKLFFFNSKLEIIRVMDYRFDFFAGTFITLFYTCVGPIAQLIIFSKTKGYPGWNLKQILLFQGVIIFTFGVYNLLLRNIRLKMDRLMRSGNFDRLLLLPCSTIGFILTGGFYVNAISPIIAGIIVIIYSIINLHMHIYLWQYLFFFLAIICGIIYGITINVIYCILSVAMINTQKISDIFDKLILFKNFPLQIYPAIMQIVFLFFIPLAVFVYVPSQILLDRLDFNIIAALIISITSLLISLYIWKKCLISYSSAGG